ncbi:ATP-binding protein [Microbacterium petrolearium]
MRDLVLQASPDFVTRLAREHDPVRAVAELIWNAIDAEADNVRVVLNRTAMDAIESVVVEDDGHGITSDEVEAAYGRIGGSWKALATTSKNGKRGLHGKRGEGRLRAFALGGRVAWRSESVNAAGTHETVIIEGSRDSGHVFRWEATPSAATRTGTMVTAWNDGVRSLTALQSEKTLPALRAHFAPVLLNEPGLTVTFDESTLDPKDEIVADESLEAPIPGHPDKPVTVRIIEWRNGTHRALYFGKDDRHFVHEAPGGDVEGVLPFSAYVTWPHFSEDSLAVLGLGELVDDVSGAVWKAAQRAIREHFAAQRRDQRRKQVSKWKETGIYPYKEEAESEPEKAERALFDVVSSAVVPRVSKGRANEKVVLNLVRDALRTDPENLGVLLSEYTALSEEDRSALTRLLTESTLANVIRSTNLVTSRNKFLAGLEHLLFDPVDSDKVGERDHLHKILERELWLFGEEYHLMSSERSLTELLRTHLRLEGLPSAGVEPVKRWDGKSGRTDLHFAAKFQEHDRVRHLVVELKAPGITASRKERDQLEDYINAVNSNAAFASDRAVWDFILLVTDFDDLVKNSIKSDDREMGLLFEPEKQAGHPQVRAYVRRWRDVIDENKRRLEFVTSALEHDPSVSDGLAYLREHYGDLLPSAEEAA